MNKDAIIVGGGIIGCSIALRLARAGLSAAIIERGKTGCQASRAAAGMLCPQTEGLEPGPFFDLCMRSRSMYKDFIAQIKELSGIDPQYRDEGTIFVALEERECAESLRWTEWQKEAGLCVETLSAGDVREKEPAVNPTAAGGVFVPEDHQVENRLLMDALSIAARRAGVEIIEGREVSSIARDGGKAKGVVCSGETIEAGVVILAAGSWSSALAGEFAPTAKVIPARGQMIALRGADNPINCVLHSHGCYIIPRLDGRILVGATVEYTGFRKAITAAGISSLLTAAIELVPALEDFEIVETWSGLRPDTADHLPIIGQSGIDNLLLATGHFRNGILLAPITAELVSEAVTSGRFSDDAKPFCVERFEKAAGVH
jgi:glycine oxidase